MNSALLKMILNTDKTCRAAKGRIVRTPPLSLKDARKGHLFRVVDVVSGHPLSDRLLELGVQAGENIAVVHEAPVSRDPIVLEVAGTRLALRREEAALILVEERVLSERVRS